MPLVVFFTPLTESGQQHEHTPVQLGPYRFAEIAGDVLTVEEKSRAIPLATRNRDGTWSVSGFDGLKFASVRVMGSVQRVPRDADDRGLADPGANDE